MFLIVEQFPLILLQLVDVSRLLLVQHLLLHQDLHIQFLIRLAHLVLLKITVLYLIPTHQKIEITDTFSEVVPKYVHLVHLKLQVQQQHFMLRTLLPLVTLLVVRLVLVYLVKVLHSGHHPTLDLDLQELLVLLPSPLHLQLILDQVYFMHSQVQQNLYLLVLFLVDYSNLVEMDTHYSVFSTSDLVDSDLVEMLQIQQQHCLLDLDHSRNSVVQQNLLLSTH